MPIGKTTIRRLSTLSFRWFEKFSVSAEIEANFYSGNDHLHGDGRNDQSGQADQWSEHVCAGEKTIDAACADHQQKIDEYGKRKRQQEPAHNS